MDKNEETQENLNDLTREACLDETKATGKAWISSVHEIEDPAVRARIYSNMITGLTSRLPDKSLTLFRKALDEYPHSIEIERQYEDVEYVVARSLEENGSEEHTVSTYIDVEGTQVEIEVEVDLAQEVKEMPSVTIEENFEFEGCEIIEAYMEAAGTDDPVFLLAKLAQKLFEKADTDSMNRCAINIHEERDEREKALTERHQGQLAELTARHDEHAQSLKNADALMNEVAEENTVLKETAAADALAEILARESASKLGMERDDARCRLDSLCAALDKYIGADGTDRKISDLDNALEKYRYPTE